MDLIYALFAFALMIFIHELGHFVTAKMFGFKVEEFAVGFGPKIFSFTKGDTVYSLRAIPLGGFNKLPEIDEQQNMKITWSLYWRRFIVLIAGGVFNIVSAILAIWLLLVFLGLPYTTNTIETVTNTASPLKAGDTILEADGVVFDGSVKDWSPLGKTSVDMKVMRDEEVIPIHIEKQASDPLGIVFSSTNIPVPFEKSFIGTYHLCENVIDRTVNGIKHMMNTGGTAAIATGVAGPIGVTQGMYAAKTATGWHGFILLTAIISANLGIMNLLPIPLLDGGRIAVDTVQLATRNRLNNKHIELSQKFGLAVLGLLFLWGTMSDLYRLIH